MNTVHHPSLHAPNRTVPARPDRTVIEQRLKADYYDVEALKLLAILESDEGHEAEANDIWKRLALIAPCDCSVFDTIAARIDSGRLADFCFLNGCHAAEEGYRWLDQDALITVPAYLRRLPLTLSFRLQCSNRAFYPRFPFHSDILLDEQHHQTCSFSTTDAVQNVTITIPAGETEATVRIRSEHSFVPAQVIPNYADPRSLAIRLSALSARYGRPASVPVPVPQRAADGAPRKCGGKLLLIGMPGWGSAFPFHSLAQVCGIVQSAGWVCRLADLNITIFRMMAPPERRNWEQEAINNGVWHNRQFHDDLLVHHGKQIEALLRNLVAGDDYDLIGFSVNENTRILSHFAARYLKSIRPDLPILFGGISCFPNVTGANYFDNDSAVPDLILRGEAEIALPEYLRAFRASDDWRPAVAGFAFRENGTVTDHGEPALPDLRKVRIRSDFSQFDFSFYIQPGDFPIFTSRGCVYRCRFCSESPNFKRFRYRLADDLLDEIHSVLPKARKFKPTPYINLSDSMLNGNHAELERFCDRIIEEKLPITWGGQAHFREELTRPFIEKLHRAGLRALLWGFESGSQKVVDLMNKRYDLHIAARIIEDGHAVGIISHMPIIVGFPGEGVRDFIDTLQFVGKYRDRASFMAPNPMYIFANSYMHEHFAEFGVTSNATSTWLTADGANTQWIRNLRAAIIENIRTAQASARWQRADLNDAPVAAELASILAELGSRAGLATRIVRFLREWDTTPLALPSAAESVPPSLRAELDQATLRHWLSLDKNTPAAKEGLRGLFAELLERTLQAPAASAGADSSAPADDNIPTERSRLVIFGAGASGERVFQHLTADHDIIAFVDNNPAKQGTVFCGVLVHGLEALTELPFDRVVLGSMYAADIRRQLIGLGVPPARIVQPELSVVLGTGQSTAAASPRFWRQLQPAC